ncbi:hypothetical protein PhCBS80983_g05422 [Powellomyces hirtus]|uniref:Pseudouridine synthase RsuA/RluA-like domain-containing protein n=1 Tax=Powellomyces hirtus TaxID=109895 RepID=A0A507DU82_9FUNG|nr:hypothetical protein PhCBS80983_g05422 [Powellomyces hirtus]
MSKSAARRMSKLAPLPKKPNANAAQATSDAEAPAVEKREFEVELDEHGMRIDEFLEKRLGLRKNVARLKVLNGEVSVRGSAHARFVDLKPAGLLNAADVVVVIVLKRRKKEEDMTKAEKKEVDAMLEEEMAKLRTCVLYKDKDVIVINKYRGLAVQGGSKISMHLDKLLDGLRFEADETPRLVHRLDKDTTGALLLARSKKSAARISKMLSSADDAIVKSYLALVGQSPLLGKETQTTGPPSNEFQRITTGIVQVGKTGVEKMSIIEWYDQDETDGEAGVKKAVTDWRVLSTKKHASLVELRPSTGRKHQLRVHCAMVLKAPILGDYKYGPGCPKSLRGVTPDPKRMPLHLHMRDLTLRDWYGAGADLHVTAPLPTHMDKLMQKLNMKIAK